VRPESGLAEKEPDQQDTYPIPSKRASKREPAKIWETNVLHELVTFSVDDIETFIPKVIHLRTEKST